MMKKLLLSPVAVLAAFSLFAQPILQNNVVPNTGDVIIRQFSNATNIEPGKAGANQVWDFTNLKPENSASSSVYEFVAPASAPHATAFPTANLVYKTNAEQPTYAYYQKENSQLTLVGVVEPTSLLEYKQPDLALPTPMRFNENVQRDFVCNVEIADGKFRSAGTRMVTYDAYGTLKTPLGTFPNAMRVRFESSQIDTTPQTKNSTIVNHTNTVIYSWYVAGQSDALLSIYYTDVYSDVYVPGMEPYMNENPTIKGANYISSVTAKAFTAPNTLAGLTFVTLGPNPATEQLLLRFSMETPEKSLQLLITDAMGKEVEKRTVRTVAGENTVPISVSHLTAGNYFLTLSDGQKAVTQAWVKQ